MSRLSPTIFAHRWEIAAADVQERVHPFYRFPIVLRFASGLLHQDLWPGSQAFQEGAFPPLI